MERITQEFLDGDSRDYDSSPIVKDMREKEVAAAQLVRRGIMLDASFAPAGSPLLEVRELLEPLQPLNSMLFWTEASPSDEQLGGVSDGASGSSDLVPISVVEFPRLGLSFDVVQEPIKTPLRHAVKVFCREKEGFFVTRLEDMELGRQKPLRRLTEGLQNFLILEDAEGNVELLLAVCEVDRQFLKGSPYHPQYRPAYSFSKPDEGELYRRSYFFYPGQPQILNLTIPTSFDVHISLNHVT